MLIDFHTHAFPDKLAPRAIDALSKASGGLEPQTDGAVGGLKKLMDSQGVDISVVLSIATNASQQKNVNDFAASVNNCSDIFAFGSVYPHSPDALDELDRIKSLGLKGVKLHPEYQQFYTDDEKMKPIYQKISRLGLITVFHSGMDFGYRPPYHNMPENLEKAVRWFESPVIAAHWGGVGVGEEVIKRLCGLDLYFDTSFGYGTMPRYVAETIIEKHGTDKLVFGTDAPWHCAEWEQRLIESLGLSESEKEKIYFKNARQLLEII